MFSQNVRKSLAVEFCLSFSRLKKMDKRTDLTGTFPTFLLAKRGLVQITKAARRGGVQFTFYYSVKWT